MRLDVLFPSKQAWLKALRLAIPTYIGGVILFNSIFIIVFAITILMIANDPRVGINQIFILLLVDISLLLIALGWFFLIGIIWGWIIGVFCSNPPQWLRPSRISKEGLSDFLISLLATLPIMMVLFFKVGISTYQDINTISGGNGEGKIYLPILVSNWSVLWLITSAFLYHWGIPFRKNQHGRKNK